MSGRKRVFFEVSRDPEGVEDAISDGFCASHCQNHQDSPTTVTLPLLDFARGFAQGVFRPPAPAEEEEKAIFFGPGPARVLDFAGMEIEPERFSPDKDWMPSLVLLAKNAYVWLDQMTKHYQRPINRLDQIPDAELDALARYGFSGLWLIGLWERSPASKRIKQLRGNEDAVASAYSLFDYQIADDLGGEESYQKLRDRAWQRGIRLASDMVPNHMGIDSRWVIEHPDWFVALDYSPFPSYSFSGINTCQTVQER